MATLYEKRETNSSSTTDIAQMRAIFLSRQEVIDEEKLIKNPFELFKEWFENALGCSQIEEANAMCLATCTKDGFPSARYVLLKSYDENGFIFYTNFSSRKGKELEENPNVAVVFFWEPLRRSVRIEGRVTKIPDAICDEYFHSRPRESQIGACVSHQSSIIPNRKVLDDEMLRLKKVYENGEVPRPRNWGGFLIKPCSLEFWQGQCDRLHDRIRFRRPAANEKLDKLLTYPAEDGWVYERLSP